MKRAVVAALAVAAALPAGAAEAATVSVSVQFSAFGPSQQDILPGETIEWENVSERRHTVTADDGSFDSGKLRTGKSCSRKFDKPGKYPLRLRPVAADQGRRGGEGQVEPAAADAAPAIGRRLGTGRKI